MTSVTLQAVWCNSNSTRFTKSDFEWLINVVNEPMHINMVYMCVPPYPDRPLCYCCYCPHPMCSPPRNHSDVPNWYSGTAVHAPDWWPPEPPVLRWSAEQHCTRWMILINCNSQEVHLRCTHTQHPPSCHSYWATADWSASARWVGTAMATERALLCRSEWPRSNCIASALVTTDRWARWTPRSWTGSCARNSACVFGCWAFWGVCMCVCDDNVCTWIN